METPAGTFGRAELLDTSEWNGPKFVSLQVMNKLSRLSTYVKFYDVCNMLLEQLKTVAKQESALALLGGDLELSSKRFPCLSFVEYVMDPIIVNKFKDKIKSQIEHGGVWKDWSNAAKIQMNKG